MAVTGWLRGQVPTGHATGTGQFLANLASEDEEPQTLAEWMSGPVYEPAPEHPAH